MHWQKLTEPSLFKNATNTIFPDFFLLIRAAKAQASLCISKNSLSLCCIKIRQIQNSRFFFVSRLTHAAKAQAGLCIGISSSEPSLLENAITVHCKIFHIKHRNINKRVIRTYFLKKKPHTIRTLIQCLHCLPRYKD